MPPLILLIITFFISLFIYGTNLFLKTIYI